MRRYKHVAFSMRVTVITLFITLSVLIIAVALGLQYYFSQSLARDAAKAQFSHVADSVSEEFHTLDSRSSASLQLLSQYFYLEHSYQQESLPNVTRMMAQAMRQEPFLYAMYMGYGNGDFYELINLENNQIARQKLGAKASDRWASVRIYNSAHGRVRKWVYYNKDFVITHQLEKSSDFYANLRPWYRNALKKDGVIKTAPYLFNNTQLPGVTYAKKIPGTKNVIAADIPLNTLSHYLVRYRPYPNAKTFIFDNNGNLIADSFNIKYQQRVLNVKPIALTRKEKAYIRNLGVLTVSNELNWPPFDFSSSGVPQGYSVEFMQLLADKLGLRIKFLNGYDWETLTKLFKNNHIDILNALFNIPSREKWGIYTHSYIQLSTAAAILTDNSHINSLAKLKGKKVAIPKGWALSEVIQKNYPEIHVVTTQNSMGSLVALQEQRVDAVIDTSQVLHYLTHIHQLHKIHIYQLKKIQTVNFNQGLSLLIHANQPELRALLDKAIASVSARQKDYLKARWLDDTAPDQMRRSIRSGVVPGKIFTQLAHQVTPISPNRITDGVTIDNVSYTVYVHQMLSGSGDKNYIGVMVPTANIMQPYMNKIYMSLLVTLALLVLITPVLIYFSQMIVLPVKKLSDENERIKERDFSSLHRVKSHITEINELSQSMYNMALSIVRHQRQQQKLLDSFIQLIAQAIDDKSPFTGMHCARVPELSIMLADAANHSSQPGLKNFDFTDSDKQYEFKIAAWLHDCGKITTPEHIIDKGSKLETIYNRIHEIRTRFEVLWRDAEIAYWKGLANGDEPLQLEKTWQDKQAQILSDFAFIAQCNIGSEQVDEQQLTRIARIAEQTWTRHLDDRLGLSPWEVEEMAHYESPTLPCEEPLLADKPQHLRHWVHHPKEKMADEIKMQIPDLAANLGEVYNLSIQRGTLTVEDRFRINEHIIATISMLESLPLPKELSRVPEIAGGHHETLIGTGYPRGLTGEQLSTEARILAVADVFEALTASDRPYKKAKTLSEALDILSSMVDEQKLDRDIFQLLIRSGVYKRYAEKFIDESQFDEVDENKYLN
ncbi:HD domain-containing phosphohydrolase [Celerinatantimonas sp. MCCC 1A17872]|uniref:HD domain-containing phosphohydrolase n=1 Tax=Celerinatantimonas sp. MCCC 1A17872 TaxID=3177514 RepID=UPI0038C42705